MLLLTLTVPSPQSHNIYFHKIGTPQSADELIQVESKAADLITGAGTTEDQRFIHIAQSAGTSGNNLLIKDIKNPTAGFVKIVDNFDNDWNVIDNDGDWVLILTNYKAPRYRIIAVNPSLPDEKNWKEIIAEDAADVLQGVNIVGEK